MLNDGIFPSSCADSFLFPISKINVSKTINYLRPIALLNVSFKLPTKVLVNRIKPIPPKLISLTQSSIILGRQIIDNIVVVQEVLHSMRSRADEKAYERVRWEFLEDTLTLADLPPLLVRTIMRCQSEGSTKLL
ncbi:hypothetical protein V2J09_018172 [Rumex salicifolius]